MPAVAELKGAPQSEQYPYDIFQIGDQAHVKRYTDIDPATVVEVSPNGKRVVIQIDNAQLADGESPEFVKGGFAGHCTNQGSLKYDITRNTSGRLETLTLRKWRGRYVWTPQNQTPDGTMYLGAGWRKLHDYNF